jgi:hypothetical protein
MSEEDYETAEEKAERKRAEREERMPRDEEKKVPIEYHPDEEWLHHSALTEEEEAKMDPEGILKKLAEEFTRKREKFRVDPTFGFTSARGEYCYLCESHPFQPKDGENPYLKTINQIIDLYGKGKTLAWVCWKAEEYYQTHILKETRKIMRMQNFANHILEHNPSQSSLAQTQLSSLIRLSNAISKRVFPPDDEVPIDVKYVTVFHKNFEQIRKAKRFLDEAARK